MGASLRLCVSIFPCRLRQTSEIRNTHQSSENSLDESACHRAMCPPSSRRRGPNNFTPRVRNTLLGHHYPKPWAGQGLRFGLAVWLLWAVPIFLIQYAGQPFPGSMIAKETGIYLHDLLLLCMLTRACTPNRFPILVRQLLHSKRS